jgi:Delta7-sterol 5-desaturase
VDVKEFVLRCVLSGVFASILYLISGAFWARRYSRDVSRSVVKHDVKLGFISLLFGSPVLQVFAYLADRYHFTKVYTSIGDKGWLWWAVSVPLYLLCWDLVFYLTHLVLHVPYVYRKSHFRHHACRPPVPWSGIAIDPFETILSGILPYTVPLFFFPFHVWTVYALNIALMFWATMVHSSFPWQKNAIFMTPKDHNLHHALGLKNANFAAVFTFWDHIGKTLDRRRAPPWWGKEGWRPRGDVATGAVTEAERALAEMHGLKADERADLRTGV